MEPEVDDIFKQVPPPPRSSATTTNKRNRDHEIPWLCTLIKSRLYIGPFPSRQEDVNHLVLELGVTHMINLCVETDKKTKNGLSSDSWYTCYFKAKVVAEMQRIPLPSDFTLWSETKQIDFYLQTAKTVCDLLQKNKDICIYVHNKSGFAEEAMTSFLAWRMFDKVSFPENVQLWLRQHLFERVLDSEDQIALLKKAIEKSKSIEKGGMTKWVTVVKKTKI